MKETNWYVLTGGPGSGKTTTINSINKRGYKTTIEHARHYVDATANRANCRRSQKKSGRVSNGRLENAD